jgi:hypothetical protein
MSKRKAKITKRRAAKVDTKQIARLEAAIAQAQAAR